MKTHLIFSIPKKVPVLLQSMDVNFIKIESNNWRSAAPQIHLTIVSCFISTKSMQQAGQTQATDKLASSHVNVNPT